MLNNSLKVRQKIHYKYLDNDTSVYLLYRPAPSSRNISYYTQNVKGITNNSNVLKCYLDLSLTKNMIVEQNANILRLDLKQAKDIASSLKIPLVVNIYCYCNIVDREEIQEIFYWNNNVD